MKLLWLCGLVALTLGMQPASVKALDATGWAHVLSQYVRQGRVDYAALHKDQDARSRLNAFVRSAQRMREDEPLATWLNVYNALVVASLVDRFPLRSVRDVSGFFDAQRHRVAGQLRTLDEIELVILDRFKDSRVHAALCSGAISSPPLQSTPFFTETLDLALTHVAQRLVADNAHIRREGDRLAVSSLFLWSKDFARDAGSLVGWIKKYGGARWASLRDDVLLIEIDYDWAINGT